MERGFSLNELIDYYIWELSGLAWSDKHKQDIPIVYVYNDVMELLNKDDDRAKKHKEKILGKTCLSSAPDKYWEVGAVIDMGISYIEWKLRLPIDDRAMILARRYIKGMIEIVDAHREEIERAIEARRTPKGGK